VVAWSAGLDGAKYTTVMVVTKEAGAAGKVILEQAHAVIRYKSTAPHSKKPSQLPDDDADDWSQ